MLGPDPPQIKILGSSQTDSLCLKGFATGLSFSLQPCFIGGVPCGSLSPPPLSGVATDPPPPAAQGAVPAAVQGHRGGAAHGGRLRLVRATPGRVGLTCRSVLTVKPHRFLPDHHLSLGMACVSFIHTDRQTFSNIPPPCFLFLRHFESFPCSKPQWKKIFCSMPKAHFFHW